MRATLITHMGPREQDRRARWTKKCEKTATYKHGRGLRRRCPEVGFWEVGVSRRQNNLTDGCLPFLTKRQKLRHNAWARIFENLHLFTFLRAHPAERFFALDCAAG